MLKIKLFFLFLFFPLLAFAQPIDYSYSPEWGAIGNDDIYNLNSGNVGIATTKPLYKLDVTGNANITDTLTVGTFSPTTITANSGTFANLFVTNNAEFKNIIAGTWSGDPLLISKIPTIPLETQVSGTLPTASLGIVPLATHTSGTLPTASMAIVDLSGNMVSGTLPNDKMSVINLAGTGVSGTLPSDKMTVINLAGGMVSGTLPADKMTVINLAGGMVSGTLPSDKLDTPWETPGTIGSTTANTGKFSTLETTGNVGIGTTNSGGYALWVQGDEYVNGDTYQGDQYNVVGNIGTQSGNIGIGTTNPVFLFDVRGDYSDIVSIIGTNVGIGLSNPFGRFQIGTTPGVPLLIVKDSGNIGIGTTNPTNKLYVAGTGYSDGLIVGSYSGLAKLTSGAVSAITDSSANWDTAYTHSQDNTQAHSDYLLNNADDDTSGILTVAGFKSTGNVGIGNTAPQRLLDVSTTPGTGLIVTSAGSVGIGTTGPGAKLDIDRGDSADPFAIRYNYSETDTVARRVTFFESDDATPHTAYFSMIGAAAQANRAFLIQTTGDAANTGNVLLQPYGGNVGIGYTSPFSTLTVNSDGSGTPGDATKGLFVGPAGYNGIIGMNIWYNNNPAGVAMYIDSLRDSADGHIYIRTKTAGTPINALTIKADGNIGIGTTGPGRKLDVVGLIRTDNTVPLLGFTIRAPDENWDNITAWFPENMTIDYSRAYLTGGTNVIYTLRVGVGETGAYTNLAVGDTATGGVLKTLTSFAPGNTIPGGQLLVFNIVSTLGTGTTDINFKFESFGHTTR